MSVQDVRRLKLTLIGSVPFYSNAGSARKLAGEDEWQGLDARVPEGFFGVNT